MLIIQRQGRTQQRHVVLFEELAHNLPVRVATTCNRAEFFKKFVSTARCIDPNDAPGVSLMFMNIKDFFAKLHFVLASGA